PRYSAEYPAGWNLEPEDPAALKWRPSIHMPRWASRITLEVTDIRVERLQDIKEEDAKAEGANGGCCTCGNPQPCRCDNPDPLYVESFYWQWVDIYGKENWNNNPWVWVIEFRRINK
ncbi:hypothetical protein KKJ16_20915, partial [Xenorhabdus bovienii]|nr:hypothetical protein [Xenorhabdus bovienii]